MQIGGITWSPQSQLMDCGSVSCSRDFQITRKFAENVCYFSGYSITIFIRKITKLCNLHQEILIMVPTKKQLIRRFPSGCASFISFSNDRFALQSLVNVAVFLYDNFFMFIHQIYLHCEWICPIKWVLQAFENDASQSLFCSLTHNSRAKPSTGTIACKVNGLPLTLRMLLSRSTRIVTTHVTETPTKSKLKF